MKKIVATLMATLMAVGMLIGGGTTAFAAGIKSDTAFDTETAIQYLEITYEENGSAVGYYYTDSSYYFSGLTNEEVEAGLPDGYTLVSYSYTAMGVTAVVTSDSVDTGSTDTGSSIEDTTGSTTEDTTGSTTEETTDTTTETTTETTTTTKTTTETTVEVVEDSDYIEDLVARIHLASVDETGAVEVTNLATLPIEVMQALKDCGNVSLTSTFIYNDVEYTITIPAGEAIVDEDIQWYGPMWLNAHYGQGTTTATITSGSTYTVVSGDTLSLIAAEHDMGLAELVAKNPQIANINLIFPGQVINL